MVWWVVYTSRRRRNKTFEIITIEESNLPFGHSPALPFPSLLTTDRTPISQTGSYFIRVQNDSMLLGHQKTDAHFEFHIVLGLTIR